MRLIRYLKHSVPAVLLIIVLLAVQAVADLALPSYTSNIVDVGILKGGIEGVAPTHVRAESLSRLEWFMTPEEIARVETLYAPPQDGARVLAPTNEEDDAFLKEAFGIPMLLLSREDARLDIAGLEAGVAAGVVSKEQLLAIRDRTSSSLGDLADSSLAVAAAAFQKAEYEALGMDTHRIQMRYMAKTGGLMLLLTLFSVLAAILVSFLSGRVAAGISRDLRARIFGKIMKFSGAEIDRFTTASLITRSTNDIQQVQFTMVMALRLVLFSPIMGIGGIVMVSRRGTGLGWIIGVAVAFLLVFIFVLVQFTMPKFKKMQTLVDRLNLVSRETLTGLPVIRAFSREKHEEGRFDDASRALTQTQLFTGRAMSLMFPMMMLLMNVVTVGIVWFGASAVDNGRLLVGDMIAFLSYSMQIVISFMMLSFISIMLPRANVAAERIDEVIAAELSIRDKDDAVARLPGPGVVRYDHVTFRFPGAEEDVLHDVSFTARPGQTTAIIGSTGSGKTTLMRLLPRFYDVTEGKITIDDVDIRDVRQATLRDALGFVPQKGVLFSGDIAGNLRFGHANISDETLREAADIAQATEFIDAAEEGFSRSIAQGGGNVSGGQKQRLSIARAIAKKPKIFVFDDSFSALDYKTDAALRKALREKVGDATVIIVAQRISTILHADQIIVLDEGVVEGIGAHAELMRSCPTYREIAESQLSEKELRREGGAVS